MTQECKDTCMCGCPMDGHSIGSGHSLVSMRDHENLTPWDRLTRFPGESAIDFACRKVEGMALWHERRARDIEAIGAVCRRIEVEEGEVASRTYFHEATVALYRAFPEC